MVEFDPLRENPWYSRREWRLHLALLLGLMGVNLWLANGPVPQLLELGGQAVKVARPVAASLMHILVSLNVVGFIAGNFLAMIPIKGLPFAWKYGRISMMTMIVIQASLCLRGLWLLMNQ